MKESQHACFSGTGVQFLSFGREDGEWCKLVLGFYRDMIERERERERERKRELWNILLYVTGLPYENCCELFCLSDSSFYPMTKCWKSYLRPKTPTVCSLT